MPNGNIEEKRGKADTELRKAKLCAKPIYNNPILLAYRLAKYMYTQDHIVWTNSAGEQKGKPYTLSGAKVCCGLGAGHGQQWDSYKRGDMDYIVDLTRTTTVHTRYDGLQIFDFHNVEKKYLPYVMFLLGDPDGWDVDSVDPDTATEQYRYTYYSDILHRMHGIVEAQREADLYIKGRTSDIFVLKQYGWTDNVTITTKKMLPTEDEAKQLLDEYLANKRIGE